MAINIITLLALLVSKSQPYHPSVDHCGLTQVSPYCLSIVFSLLSYISLSSSSALSFVSFTIAGRIVTWIYSDIDSMLSVVKFSFPHCFIFMQMSGLWLRNGGRSYLGHCIWNCLVSQKLQYHFIMECSFFACVQPCCFNYLTAVSQHFICILLFIFSFAKFCANARYCAFCWILHFWYCVMSSLFSSSTFWITLK